MESELGCMINTAKLNSFAEEGWIHYTQRVHDFSPFRGTKPLISISTWATSHRLSYGVIFQLTFLWISVSDEYQSLFWAKLSQHALADNDGLLYLVPLKACFFPPIFFFSLWIKGPFSEHTPCKGMSWLQTQDKQKQIPRPWPLFIASSANIDAQFPSSGLSVNPFIPSKQ